MNKAAGHVTASASCSPAAEEEVFLPMLHKVDAGGSASSDFLRSRLAPKNQPTAKKRREESNTTRRDTNSATGLQRRMAQGFET